MRYGKILAVLVTLCFLGAALFVWSREPRREEPAFLAGQERLRCQGQWGEYTLYLPGYVQLEQVKLPAGAEVCIDGVPLEAGASCGGFLLDTPYEVQWGREHFRLTFRRSGNVPSLHLDLASGSMDYVNQDKQNTEPGTARLYDSQGNLTLNVRFDALKGRGSSTWAMEKKPYNLEFAADTDLLGLGAAKNWVLLANACDPSQLRNALVYGAAGELGLAYTPQTAFLDLYLNGEYAGLYLLCERNEVHRQRVDLTADAYFLVSKEWEWRMESQSQPYVQLDSRAALRLHDTNMAPAAVESLFQQLENAILSPDGRDPDTGVHFRELMDLDSWVRKYLLEECFGNVDGGTLSQFFWYDGDKIHAGPIWDYDLTLGNRFAYPYPAENMFYVNREGVYASTWLPALYQNPEFFSRLRELYQQEFRPVLEQLVQTGVEDLVERLAPALAMNAARWQEDPWTEAAYIKEYLSRRIEFLDAVWLRQEAFFPVQVRLMDDTLLRFLLRPGETLPQLPQYEDTETVTVHGWQNKATAEPVDVSQPLYEEMEIVLNFETAPPQPLPEEPLSVLHLAPAVVLAALLGVLAVVDRKRNRYE